MERGLAAEKMSVVWKKKEPEKWGAEPEMILAGSTLRVHAPGIESLQYGSGVSYVFRLDQPLVPEQYAKMQQEAREGKLAGIDLLIGFTESYEDSGQLGSLAYMVTTAHHLQRY